jgi:hypothetical protein
MMFNNKLPSIIIIEIIFIIFWARELIWIWMGLIDCVPLHLCFGSSGHYLVHKLGYLNVAFFLLGWFLLSYHALFLGIARGQSTSQRVSPNQVIVFISGVITVYAQARVIFHSQASFDVVDGPITMELILEQMYEYAVLAYEIRRLFWLWCFSVVGICHWY